MISPVQLDMEKICRVCMRSDLELFLIFDEKYSVNKTNLSAILSECTMYKVNRYDDLPHQICSLCMEMAKSAFNFKRTCERSYRMLIGMVVDDTNQEINKKEKPFITDISARKCTQTDDSTLYPCERCDKKFFAFDELRHHREYEHKGCAIVCRFCSKTFNRVGYLRTHIAVFHPESGYISQNQCKICKRQFTRREHLRRHLTLIHKLAEDPIDQENKTIKCEVYEKSEGEISSDNIEKFADRTDCRSASPANAELVEITPKISRYDSDDDRTNDVHDMKRTTTTSDDEDEKPLAMFLKESCTQNGAVPLNLNGITSECLNKMTPIRNGSEVEALPQRQVGEAKTSATLNSLECQSMEKNHEYKCEKCNVVFLRHSTLLRHMPYHKDSKLFECKICNRRFSRAHFLQSHIKGSHDVSRITKCIECDKDFSHESQYKRHMESKHSGKTHKCEICQKSFATKLYMQRHLVLHGKKRFMCKECSEKFATRDELKAHIAAEGHDKPMLCPECGLRCKTSNILMIHMRRHQGEKPFKCKFCSKGFPRMDDLRVHERYHTGEKSHFCETCGKGFQRKYNLTIHMRVHTGEKPYKCPHCTHAFKQRNDLKAHIRRHTGERFRCELCNAGFLQGYQMRQHKLIEHGVKEDPPTKRVEKFTSPEEQELQIKQNMQRDLL